MKRTPLFQFLGSPSGNPIDLSPAILLDSIDRSITTSRHEGTPPFPPLGRSIDVDTTRHHTTRHCAFCSCELSRSGRLCSQGDLDSLHLLTYLAYVSRIQRPPSLSHVSKVSTHRAVFTWVSTLSMTHCRIYQLHLLMLY